MQTETDRISERLAALRKRIAAAADKAGRDPEKILLIGVTKTKPAALIRVGASLGIFDIGENYAQECALKYQELSDLPLRWHFIGGLQRNKVRLVLPFVHMIHGVDSARLGAEIDRQAAVLGRRVPVLMQVNTSGEATKHGVEPAAATDLARQLAALPNLDLRGLMTLAAPLDDPEAVRPMFRVLRQTRDRAQDALGAALPELSMGMSNDFEAAVAEGATMVRIGSILFGQRAPAHIV